MSEEYQDTPKKQNKRPRGVETIPSPSDTSVQNTKILKTMGTLDTNELKLLIQTTIQTEFTKLTSDLKAQLQDNTREVKKIGATVKRLEDQSRKKNIIVHGIPGDPKENWKDLDQKIENLGATLGTKIDYDHGFRLGKKGELNRPILLKLMRTRDKFQIMGLTHKLKGTGIYVNEDLPPEERRKHSLLLQKCKELKQSNPQAKTSIKSGRLLQ